MGSSVLMGGICYSIPHNLNLRSRYRSNLCKLGGRNSLMMSLQSATATATTATLPSRVAPWLMLPPHFEGGDMFYNFYRLDEGLVKSVKKKREDSDQEPPDDAKLVGSSHGWIALFDENSNRVFLSNPISGRHIKLPPIDTLPDPHINLLGGRGRVSRVILSCSPGEDECRAMMSFGPGGRLAFCVPGVSTEWTPLGRAVYKDEDLYLDTKFAAPHQEDFVYCSRREVLSSISRCKFKLDSFRYDASDYEDEFYYNDCPHSVMSDWNINCDLKFPEESYMFGVTNEVNEVWEEGEHLEMLRRECIQMPHLVCADELAEDSLIVLRFVNRGIINGDPKLSRPDLYRAMVNTYPYRTVCFLVLRSNNLVLDDLDSMTCSVVKDLKGLALFVGMNHSFAIPAADFPGILKPNSIYFTDACRIRPPPHLDQDQDHLYGGHDIGIFDYDKSTISPCYNYPCDFQSFKRIHPPLMWFTPNPNY